jgi:hypothetical protein
MSVRLREIVGDCFGASLAIALSCNERRLSVDTRDSISLPGMAETGASSSLLRIPEIVRFLKP